jgi:hypothetical protein
MLTESSAKSRRSHLRGATTGAALAAFAVVAGGLLVSAPAVADPPTTFTNSTPITIATDTPAPPTPATPYPSTITVSGMAGPVLRPGHLHHLDADRGLPYDHRNL